MDKLDKLLGEVEAAAERAGGVIMRYYHGNIASRLKPDASPVTAADEAAEREILAALPTLLPDVPIVSEEAAASGQVPEVHGAGNKSGRFWLVDPLDGTKEFLSRNGEFTVNIALIERGRPILGVVYLPTMGTTYSGIAGSGARKRGTRSATQAIAVRPAPADGVIVLASRSHGDGSALDAFLADHNVAERRNAGSSLKFCHIAEGIADLYPRFGRTMEWDTAAGHAVLCAAGGAVTMLDGADLMYGKPGFANPHFIARGRHAE